MIRTIMVAGALAAGLAGSAVAAPPSEAPQPVASEKLPNVPGKTISLVRVKYAPGGSSAAHHHAGSVMAYVLSGSIRSQVAGSPAKVYAAGQTFFEPPGGTHLVSQNASATEPAELLAIFIADDGATLTMPGPR